MGEKLRMEGIVNNLQESTAQMFWIGLGHVIIKKGEGGFIGIGMLRGT